MSAVRARRRASDQPADADTLVGQLENLEVIICCGSGGVGKTTISAALGLAIAQRSDRRVLGGWPPRSGCARSAPNR